MIGAYMSEMRTALEAKRKTWPQAPLLDVTSRKAGSAIIPSLRHSVCTSEKNISLDEKLRECDCSLAHNRSVVLNRILGRMIVPPATVFIATKETLTFVNQCKISNCRENITVRLHKQVFSDHQADFAMVLPAAKDGKINIVRIEIKSCICVGQYLINTLHEKGSL